MIAASRKSSWIAIAIAAAIVAGVIAVAADLWAQIGDVGLSPAGWLALALGVLVTLALGNGLMARVFISSRRGWDEPSERR